MKAQLKRQQKPLAVNRRPLLDRRLEDYRRMSQPDPTPPTRSVRDYLPTAKSSLVFIQGRIPRELFEELKEVLEEEGLSWSKYFVTVTRHFLDEMKARRGKR